MAKTANMSQMTVPENMAEIEVVENMAEMAVTDQDISYGVENEYRVALIGRTGSGKSATGNNILGKEAFESKMCGTSVTKRCEYFTAERFGKKLVVVDTPGLFDTTLSNECITEEITKCIGILSPGPHAFILVVSVGRFTPEEQNTITHFSSIFGKEFHRYLIVLFTRRDELEKNDMTIHEYVKEVPDELKNILQRCGQKYLAFDNSRRGRELDSDTPELMKMLQAIMNETGRSYYTNKMFDGAEKEFQRRAEENRLKGKEKIDEEQKKMQEDLETRKRQIDKQKEEIEAKQREIEAKELENKTKESECSEKSQKLAEKQEAIEAEIKELEAKELENVKYELEKKREIEEMKQKQEQENKNMRDNFRDDCKRGDKNVLKDIIGFVVNCVLTLFGWG